MTTTPASPARVATAAEKTETTKATKAAQHKKLSDLTTAFQTAHTGVETNTKEALKFADSANVAAVMASRAAYLVAIHPEVFTTQARKLLATNNDKETTKAKREGRKPVLGGQYNINGAATALGVSQNTARPYVLAGAKLAKANRVYVTTVTQADIDLYTEVRKTVANKAARDAKAKADAKAGVDTKTVETKASDALTVGTVTKALNQVIASLELLTKNETTISEEEADGIQSQLEAISALSAGMVAADSTEEEDAA